MRSSLILASALAMGAIASPLLEKRYIVTEVDLEVKTVIVYVTPGAPAPTPESNHGGHHHGRKSSSKAASSTQQAPPAYTPAPPPPSSTPKPAPTSVYTPPPPPPSSVEQSSEAPASSAPANNGEHKSGDIQATFQSGADYQAAVLYHHNAARANHDAAPLEWDNDLADRAGVCAKNCDFKHFIIDESGDGQNLFTVSGDSFNVTAGITESWYKGELDAMMPYFGQDNVPEDVFHSVGHLTAMLWKSTTKVGCFSHDCGSAMKVGDQPSSMNKYTVCNYHTAGNMQNEYGAQVSGPKPNANLGSWSD
ncbi:PR-1-like protein [Polyplosphaeria fusca]|uniref:PR-1-like protein n=1 Tax=Polyplosphaeria fusca TaxID=682080 RepID=A0A9P4V1W2_9PLEO|nr:PR-1-like protein [Polyplosphaeria fusca]